MMIMSLILAVAICALLLYAVEKKRAGGKLTYPLWEGNLLIPWAMFAALFMALICAFTLPQFVHLKMRGVNVQGTIVDIKENDYCKVTYNYTVAGKNYTNTDHRCKRKIGAHTVYYDPVSPDFASIYTPDEALYEIIAASLLLCLVLPTILVLWLKITYVIGRPKKTT